VNRVSDKIIEFKAPKDKNNAQFRNKFRSEDPEDQTINKNVVFTALTFA
jgi:hypothetical protein